MHKILEVGLDMILIIRVVMDIMWEVVRDMGDRIIVTEGETVGTRTMIEIGVGHMRDKIETEEMIEELVIADWDQVQEQLQIGMELDVLIAESMTILWETIQWCKQTERQNKSSRCSTWMKIRQYDKPHWWM